MKKHVFPLGITLLTLAAWLIALPHLPATMPIHWGANGEADGFATKINAMILTVGIMVLIYFIIAFIFRELTLVKKIISTFQKRITSC